MIMLLQVSVVEYIVSLLPQAQYEAAADCHKDDYSKNYQDRFF
jgi:hypothetical protein